MIEITETRREEPNLFMIHTMTGSKRYASNIASSSGTVTTEVF